MSEENITSVGKEITTIHHQCEVNSVIFSSDSQYLATGSDYTAKVLEVATDKQITTIHHHGWVYSLIFSPDGQYLATRSEDKTVKVIEVATGKQITTIQHQDWVNSVIFSPDSQYLATRSSDNTAKVVEVATGKQITTIQHQNWVNSVIFSPDSQYLATGSRDKTAKLINLKKIFELMKNKQNYTSSAIPSPVSSLVNFDRPQAFFLRWLQNQANSSSFYEYLLQQAQQDQQGFSIRNQTPLLDTDLFLQSLNFLLMNGEKHYQTVFPMLKGIEDKSIQIIALYDLKQNIIAALSSLYEFIHNLMKFEGKNYQKAVQVFQQEIEKEVAITEIAIDIYKRLQILSKLEGIENLGELATIKDMLGKMLEIFKKLLPLSITSSMPPKVPAIPLKVDQKQLLKELRNAINQAKPTKITDLIESFYSLGLKIDKTTVILDKTTVITKIKETQPNEMKHLVKSFHNLGLKIDEEIAKTVINKYNRFIFVRSWNDIKDFPTLLRFLGD